ncbi:hypothetical protein D3C71_1535990 [compost metagenome]
MRPQPRAPLFRPRGPAGGAVQGTTPGEQDGRDENRADQGRNRDPDGQPAAHLGILAIVPEPGGDPGRVDGVGDLAQTGQGDEDCKDGQ